MNLEKLQMLAQQLPAYEIAGKVNDMFSVSANVVITAPPGAGKSTLLPLTMLQGYPDAKILVLEPRRLAAKQIAERMAAMIDEPVGQTVGYRVRFENRVGPDTRIEVLTEGILTRMLVDDPTLEGVGIVVFDEFHERSLNADVAYALTHEAQQLIRPDLKIAIMSATLGAELTLGGEMPVVESQGRMYPVEVRYGEETDLTNIAEVSARAVRAAHQTHEGDILVFLPGESEIHRCSELLEGRLGNTRICPLYGMLSAAEQHRAIAPSVEGERKVVLATPIAETSLTIEGVRVVVDAGWCRKLVYNAQTGLSRLETVRISLDMAHQRAGRAGRVAPGVCYRLWSIATEHRMAECRTPEILEADLSGVVLDVAAWGESDALRLPWLTLPPAAHIGQAQQLLRWLEALDDGNRITSHGKHLGKMPCHPRMAQMLCQADNAGQKALAADIAALLEEKDPLAQGGAGCDINVRLEALRRGRGSRQWSRIGRIAEQYRRLVGAAEDNDIIDPWRVGVLLAQAYPERVAKAKTGAQPGRYVMASGDEVWLDANDDLSAYDWLAIADVNVKSGAIFLASPVDVSQLKSMQQERECVTWDSKQGRVVAQREWRLGVLLVSAQSMGADNRDLQVQAICSACAKEGTSMLDFNEAVENLQIRVATLANWHPELGLPDLSTVAVLSTAAEWLPLYLGKATTAGELKKIDLCVALWGLLSYEQQQTVERLAPSHIQVPTGSRIRVEYRQGAECPVLRVRLQECFGLTDTPRVDDGRCPVLMELLSPGFKPVQLTKDLRSFWENTYFEVRKELRRRYPKHAWPDNPLEAQAVRGVVKKC